MGFIGKSFAIVMMPLSILIILENMQIYSVTLPVDKVLVGAGLMIVLQLITLFMVHKNTEGLGVMNFVTAFVFIGTAIAAVVSGYFSFYPKETVFTLGLMMFFESIYALH
jgi:hypothetical protein